MSKRSLSKSAEVIAFLNANSVEISIKEKPKASEKSLRLKGKPSKGNSRKAS
jgi:hypothetical protein